MVGDADELRHGMVRPDDRFFLGFQSMAMNNSGYIIMVYKDLQKER